MIKLITTPTVEDWYDETGNTPILCKEGLSKYIKIPKRAMVLYITKVSNRYKNDSNVLKIRTFDTIISVDDNKLVHVYLDLFNVLEMRCNIVEFYNKIFYFRFEYAIYE